MCPKKCEVILAFQKEKKQTIVILSFFRIKRKSLINIFQQKFLNVTQYNFYEKPLHNLNFC